MMNAADSSATNLNGNTDFSNIQIDEDTQWINVYSPMAQENFRAGKSVRLNEPIEITGTPFHSEVCSIVKVNPGSLPQRVLLSLFSNLPNGIQITRHKPPDEQDGYVQYPPNHLAWTQYQGWYPVTRIRSEAFVVAPWEAKNVLNDAHLCHGITNAYCVLAKWEHDNCPPRRALIPLGNDHNNIPGCLHLIDFPCVTLNSWCFRMAVASKIVESLCRASSAACTKVSFQLTGVPKYLWVHFKKHTIPLENTAKALIVTKRTIQKNLVVEMIKDSTVNHFARFDTDDRLNLLKGYLTTKDWADRSTTESPSYSCFQ
jgi:hypothetical protein